MKINLIGGVLLGLMAASGAMADVSVVTDTLNGVISGLPGETIGWGFTVTPDATQWISFSSSSLLYTATPAFDIQSSYTDFIAQQGGPIDFAVPPVPVGAGDWVETFNSADETGIGSVTVPLSAAPGTSDSGVLLLQYDLYSGDPTLCGNCMTGSGSVRLPFTVEVPITVASTPEPSSWGLMAAGLAAALAFRVRPRRLEARRSGDLPGASGAE